jgi:hypothetical protein
MSLGGRKDASTLTLHFPSSRTVRWQFSVLCKSPSLWCSVLAAQNRLNKEMTLTLSLALVSSLFLFAVPPSFPHLCLLTPSEKGTPDPPFFLPVKTDLENPHVTYHPSFPYHLPACKERRFSCHFWSPLCVFQSYLLIFPLRGSWSRCVSKNKSCLCFAVLKPMNLMFFRDLLQSATFHSREHLCCCT